MAYVLLVCLLKKEVFLFVIAFNSHRNVWRYDDVAPESSHQARRPLLLLLAFRIRRERPVGLGVSAESLLECESAHPPLFVVVVVHDGRTPNQQHIVVPINEISPVVVPLFVKEPYLLIPVLLDVELGFGCIDR